MGKWVLAGSHRVEAAGTGTQDLVCNVGMEGLGLRDRWLIWATQQWQTRALRGMGRRSVCALACESLPYDAKGGSCPPALLLSKAYDSLL